jgi:RNase H-fold protein (predicted Holliday junction resolvase)
LRVLSVDPGRDKCGVVVLDERDGVLARGVVPTDVVTLVARDWARAYGPERIVLGNGTHHREVRNALRELGLPVDVTPERHTTERARKRYFQEHPPKGIWRFFPGLCTPPMPIDDYAAILIAEDYLAGKRGGAAA